MSIKPTVVELRPSVNTKVVERLEELLAEAKEGRLQSLMYICEAREGGTVSGWTACQDLQRNLAEACRLVHLIQKRMDDNAVTEHL